VPPPNRDRSDRAPYRLKAFAVRASRGNVYITLADGIIVVIPVSTLGEPWATSSARVIANISLRLSGAWLWWEDLDEGIVLDEFFEARLLLNRVAKSNSGKRQRGPSKAALLRRQWARLQDQMKEHGISLDEQLLAEIEAEWSSDLPRNE
jgi:hypothetical protein